jgi:peptidyl-prolyl cis-trans isomerase D
VALLRPADLVDEVAIEDAAVRAEYEARIGEFRSPERREVSQILAPDEETAKAAAELVATGKSFAETAQTLAEKGVSSQSLGAMTRDQLPPELADAVFALATGEVGAPVRSPFGWHLFRVDAIEPEMTRPFEAVKDELQRQLALQEAADRLPDVANVLEDAIAGGDTLEQAATQAGAEVRRLTAIDSLGRDRDGASLLSDGLTAGLVGEIFLAAQGELSSLGETADGGYYMFRVDGIEPARTKPLEEVREALTEAWKAEQRSQAAVAKAKELLGRAQAGESPEALQAATPGSELRAIGPLRRGNAAPAQGLDPAAVALVFRTEPGTVGSEVARLADGIAVLAVDAIDRPEPPDDLPDLRARLTNELRGDLLAQYEAALRLRYPPLVNERVLGALIQAEEG